MFLNLYILNYGGTTNIQINLIMQNTIPQKHTNKG